VRPTNPASWKTETPPKIHVWGGISARGATPTVMFTGTLRATRYTRILDAALVPFLEHHYPDGHHLKQDDDLKHMELMGRDIL